MAKASREEKISKARQQRRTLRTRRKLLERIAHPRLSVFRSNVHIYAQVIDDKKGLTLVSVHEKELKESTGTKIMKAEKLGELVAVKTLEKKIKQVVFDKGSYRYHGRVKAFAQGAKKGGLVF